MQRSRRLKVPQELKPPIRQSGEQTSQGSKLTIETLSGTGSPTVILDDSGNTSTSPNPRPIDLGAVQAAAQLLAADASVNYTGFVEGDGIFKGHADVYMGVFWNNKRQRTGATYPYATVQFTGNPAAGDVVQVAIGGTPISHAIGYGETLQSIAAKAPECRLSSGTVNHDDILRIEPID